MLELNILNFITLVTTTTCSEESLYEYDHKRSRLDETVDQESFEVNPIYGVDFWD